MDKVEYLKTEELLISNATAEARAALPVADWLELLREYRTAKKERYSMTDMQALARKNREFYDIFMELYELRRPVAVQASAELQTDDLNAFIAARVREADKLANALEGGQLLTADARAEAKARLNAITDELKWADVAQRQQQRKR
jgi:hypothetical protein